MVLGHSLDQHNLPSVLTKMPPKLYHLSLIRQPLASPFMLHLNHLLVMPVSTVAPVQFIFHGM